jgi:hypothetical protein
MKKQADNYTALATMLFQGDDALQQQFVSFAVANTDSNGALSETAVVRIADFIGNSRELRGEVRPQHLVRALRTLRVVA